MKEGCSLKDPPLPFWSLACALLLVFAIPIEYKYDKLFRFFSLTLIPEGLSLPTGYDKKIYFYPSDLIAPLLFGALLFRNGVRSVLDKGAACLWIIWICAAISLWTGPLSHYPLVYIRLWQLASAFSLFSFIAHAAKNKTFLQAVLWILWIAALGQSIIALIQYFGQTPLGLKMCNEPQFSVALRNTAGFSSPGGSLWLFDSSPHSPAQFVARSMGTFSHANVLGGFLALALLVSYFLLSSRAAWLVALAFPCLTCALFTTYSRSALFGWAFFSLVWISLTSYQRRSVPRRASLLFVGSLLLNITLFYHQYIQRGGIVNYTHLVQGSDQVRWFFQDVALRMIQANPLFGVGYNLFSYFSPHYVPPSVQFEGGVHNIYLLLAAETGLLSLCAFGVFLFRLMKQSRGAPVSLLSITLVTLFTFFLWIGLVDFYPLLFQSGRLLFFTLAGLLASQVLYPERSIVRQELLLKKEEIAVAFDAISPCYDRLNRILSLASDLRWRKKVAAFVPQQGPLQLLDVATGTGDQLIALFEKTDSIQQATGIDLSEKMVAKARQKMDTKSYRNRVHLQVGDAQILPFLDHSFDLCTISFGIRNIPDPLKALSEMYRVLKPGGRCLILEFSMPTSYLRKPYLFYLRYILPRLGGWLSGHPAAYHYLNRTIEEFPSGSAFACFLQKSQFRAIQIHPMQWGAVTLYIGDKV